MPKKTAHTRSTAQRNKPKAQKSIELVRPTSTSTSTSTETVTEKEVEVNNSPEPVNNGAATPAVAAPTPVSVRENESTKATAEHYGYVRKDLIFIAILAIILFGIIIGLHFVPAIGG